MIEKKLHWGFRVVSGDSGDFRDFCDFLGTQSRFKGLRGFQKDFKGSYNGF